MLHNHVCCLCLSQILDFWQPFEVYHFDVQICCARVQKNRPCDVIRGARSNFFFSDDAKLMGEKVLKFWLFFLYAFGSY